MNSSFQTFPSMSPGECMLFHFSRYICEVHVINGYAGQGVNIFIILTSYPYAGIVKLLLEILFEVAPFLIYPDSLHLKWKQLSDYLIFANTMLKIFFCILVYVFNILISLSACILSYLYFLCREVCVYFHIKAFVLFSISSSL